MRTLNRYLAGSFLVTFAMALLVVTFVMCIGIVFKVTDLIARGVSWRPVLRILLFGFPQALTYSIPVSVLAGCLLVFGRLSADGEVTAMKASGVNMWRIAMPAALVAGVCTLLCLYINSEVVPEGHYARRTEMANLGMQTPIELLEEGKFIQDYPDMTLYVGKRKDMELTNVRIYDMRNPAVRREIRATGGTVRQDDNGDLILELRDVRIDPFRDDRPGAAYAETWPFIVPRDTRQSGYRANKDDKSLRRLWADMGDMKSVYPHLAADDLARQRSVYRVAFHKRLSLAASCLAFAVLAIPLGVQSHRKESSIGVALSLLVVFIFYVFIVAADSLQRKPEALPHLIVWIPIVLAILVGALLIERHN